MKKNLQIFTSVFVLGCSCCLMKAKGATQKVDIIGQSSEGSAISGTAKIVSKNKAGSISTVHINIDRLSAGMEDDLSRGDTLEAWIVDEGLATDSALSSSNDDDSLGSFKDASTSTYSVANIDGDGVEIGDIPVINLVEAVPYALSLGTLKANDKGVYSVNWKTSNILTPYDYIIITKEAGGNQGEYDPRPGEELARARIEF